MSFWDENGRSPVWQADKIWEAEKTQNQDGSVVACSTNMLGMLFLTEYTRLHSLHLSASGSTLNTSGFLQTGQTKSSRRSWAIISGEIVRCRGLDRIFFFPKKVALLELRVNRSSAGTVPEESLCGDAVAQKPTCFGSLEWNPGGRL